MSKQEMTREDNDKTEQRELQNRVLFSLLGIIVKTSTMLGISLKELTGLVRVVYFRELRMQGLSNAEIAEHLDVSERTVKNLSRELRESYTIPEEEHNLPVQIEFMLWSEPLSEARLNWGRCLYDILICIYIFIMSSFSE